MSKGVTVIVIRIINIYFKFKIRKKAIWKEPI